VASIVDAALNLERHPSDHPRAKVVLSLASVGVLFLVAEGCSLYATATQVTTTFLLVVPTLVGMMLIVEIIAGALVRADLVKISSDDMSSQWEARLESGVKKRQEHPPHLAESADILENALQEESKVHRPDDTTDRHNR
jgi:hypothetical protein